jgi:hypothetical protein
MTHFSRKIIYIFCFIIFLSFKAHAQSDSIPGDDPPCCDTIWVKKVFIEPAYIIRPKYIFRLGMRWWRGDNHKLIRPMMYQLRYGNVPGWILWAEDDYDSED